MMEISLKYEFEVMVRLLRKWNVLTLMFGTQGRFLNTFIYLAVPGLLCGTRLGVACGI